MREGLDYAWHGTLQPQAFIDAGYSFACRYLSRDPTKDIDAAEAKLLSGAGLDIVLVWETSERRPVTGGYEGGLVDAKLAFERAAQLGMPADRPIYFAVDYDVVSTAADAYFRGIRDAGYPVERVGVYAGLRPLRHLLDVGLASYGWQTSAWSEGVWDPRAHLRQYKYGLKFPGVDSSDANHAMFEDFGQWSLRAQEEEDALTPEQELLLKYNHVRLLGIGQELAIIRAQLCGATAAELAAMEAAKEAAVAAERKQLGI
jgi:hypothetical protein